KEFSGAEVGRGNGLLLVLLNSTGMRFVLQCQFKRPDFFSSLLDDGSIRWRCRELAVDESPDFSVKPPLVTSLAAARQFFWRRATHSRIDVDWPSHGASRVGPIFRDPTPMARGGPPP